MLIEMLIVFHIISNIMLYLEIFEHQYAHNFPSESFFNDHGDDPSCNQPKSYSFISHTQLFHQTIKFV